MHIEAQLDSMFSPTVTLKSGGYIVINQTEALVSIDVNSGRATREHSIEETARKTNLEAASEIGRQLRLRDLAGLIVIDFIDMEEGRNDREVEKRLRDAVKNDRARVQIGKISQFGLLEMSRQRLRAGVVAGSTVACPHCGGVGLVRSVESSALRVLRALEEEGEKAKSASVAVKVPTDIVIYVLNQKRREVARLESEYRMEITFLPKEGLPAGEFEIERLKSRDPGDRPKSNTGIEAGFVHSDEPEPDYVEEVDEEDLIEGPQDDASDSDEEDAPAQGDGEAKSGARTDGDGRRRRRRGGRGRNRRDGQPARGEGQPRGDQPPRDEQVQGVAEDGEDSDGGDEAETATTGEAGTEQQQTGEGGRRRRRRRGRRGGRDRERPHDQPNPFPAAEPRFGEPDEVDTTPGVAPALNAAAAPVWSLSSETDDVDTTPGPDDGKPQKKGWWQKTFGGGGET
jgi:ribonuclease E